MPKKRRKYRKSTTEKSSVTPSRSTAPILNERIAIVSEYYLLGYTHKEMLQFINNGGPDGNDDSLRWNVSKSTLEYYLRKYRESAGNVLEKNIEQYYAEAVSRWRFLVRKFHREGDNTNLLNATKQLDELIGFKKTDSTIINIIQNNLSVAHQLTDEQLDLELQELETQLLGPGKVKYSNH